VPNIGGKEQIMLAVFDGHGPKGEFCSEFCAFTLTDMLEDKAKEATLTKLTLAQQVKMLNQTLLKKKQSEKSGTTATMLLLDGDKNLIVGNIGDSRAVRGFVKEGVENSWEAEVLTTDHLPEDPDEKARIIATGGYIFKEAEFGSARVFDCPDPLARMQEVAMAKMQVDTYNSGMGMGGGGGGMGMYAGSTMGGGNEYTAHGIDYGASLALEPGPGLAMSRVLGHYDAAKVGIIDEPTVNEVKLTSSDKVLILASDGLWDYIEPPQAVEIARTSFPDAVSAAKKLVNQATSAWAADTDDYRDDITVMVIYLPIAESVLKEKPKEGTQAPDGKPAGIQHIKSSAGIEDVVPTGAQDVQVEITSSTSISAVPTDSASADAMAEASAATRRVSATSAQRKRSVVTMFKVV